MVFFSSLSRGLRLAKGPSASSDSAPPSWLVRRLQYQSDGLSEGGPHPRSRSSGYLGRSSQCRCLARHSLSLYLSVSFSLSLSSPAVRCPSTVTGLLRRRMIQPSSPRTQA